MKKIDLQILKNIDDFTFAKLDELQQHPEVQKLLDQYASLDEKLQDIIKNALAALTILIPVIFISVLWSFNSSLKDTLNINKETLSLAQEIVAKDSKVSIVKRKFINSTPIKTQMEFQTKITNILSSSGIDSSKISLGGFDAVDLDAFIMESRVDLKFSKLTNNEIFSLISGLNMRLKVKFDEISIKKDTDDNLLQGILRIIYYGQDAPMEEEEL